MAMGGVRPGAGRPKLEATKLREAYIRLAELHAEEIAQALVKAAKSGNVQAIKELSDRAIGKVTENINLGGEVTILIDL